MRGSKTSLGSRQCPDLVLHYHCQVWRSILALRGSRKPKFEVSISAKSESDIVCLRQGKYHSSSKNNMHSHLLGFVILVIERARTGLPAISLHFSLGGILTPLLRS